MEDTTSLVTIFIFDFLKIFQLCMLFTEKELMMNDIFLERKFKDKIFMRLSV